MVPPAASRTFTGPAGTVTRLPVVNVVEGGGVVVVFTNVPETLRLRERVKEHVVRVPEQKPPHWLNA
jgi:hypothetical protein